MAPFGQTTALSTDANGYLASVADPAGNTVYTSHSAAGWLQSFTDPAGNTHSMTYDPATGRLLSDADPAGGFKALALSQNSDAGAADFTVGLTTALGRATSYFVDPVDGGFETRINTLPSGAQVATVLTTAATTSSVLADGTLVTEGAGPDPRFGLQSPFVQSRSITTPDAGLTFASAETRVAYQASDGGLMGLSDTVTLNLYRTFNSTFDAGSLQWTDTSAQGHRTVRTLDAYGRLAAVQPAADFYAGPGLSPTTYGYESHGLLTSATRGTQGWSHGYDSLGRLTSSTDAAGNAIAYGYGPADRLDSVTLPSGNNYSFGYDPGGNQTTLTMPSGNQHVLGYNSVDLPASYLPPAADGFPTGGGYFDLYDLDQELTLVSLPSGETIATGYGATDGRVLGISYPEASVSVEYADLTSRPATLTWTAAEDGGVSQALAFTYDGPLLTSLTYSGAANGSFTYGFDQNFFVTSFTVNGQVVNVTRDPDGLVTEETTAGATLSINRNGPAGSPGSVYASGGGGYEISSLQYNDGFGHLTDRYVSNLQGYAYNVHLVFDSENRLAQKSEIVGPYSSYPAPWVNYAYGTDVDGQLTSVSVDGGLVEQYAFDQDGNRTSKTLGTNPAETATFDAQDRLVQRGDLIYSFDADGFLQSRGSDVDGGAAPDTFEYSRRGELLAATVGGQSVSYAYDGLGRRVARTDANGTTQYLYGDTAEPFELTAEIDPSDTQTLFFYESGLLYAFQRGSAWYYVGTDQVGTPLIVSDAAGDNIRQLSYTAWGELLSDTNPGFDLPVGFAGGLADPVTGLVRFGFRDYEPASGRWTSKDPVFFKGGYDFYAYAGNNPVRFIDRSGLGVTPAPGSDKGFGERFAVEDSKGASALPDTQSANGSAAAMAGSQNPLSPSRGEGQGEGMVSGSGLTGASGILSILSVSMGTGGTTVSGTLQGDTSVSTPEEGTSDLTGPSGTVNDPGASGTSVDTGLGQVSGPVTFGSGSGEGFGGTGSESSSTPQQVVSDDVVAACGCSNPIDIAGIVANGQNQNDDAAVGLDPNVFVNPLTDLHLDLPCGAYYLTGIYGSSPVSATSRDISISVHGLTVLYVGTNIVTTGLLEITVDPAAQLSLFVGGTIQSTQPIALGSTEVPSQTNIYVGGSQGVGGSSAALIAGSLYSPNGPLDMNGTTSIYGSLLTNGMAGTGAVTIHYDQGLLSAGAACAAP